MYNFFISGKFQYLRLSFMSNRKCSPPWWIVLVPPSSETTLKNNVKWSFKTPINIHKLIPSNTSEVSRLHQHHSEKLRSFSVRSVDLIYYLSEKHCLVLFCVSVCVFIFYSLYNRINFLVGRLGCSLSRYIRNRIIVVIISSAFLNSKQFKLVLKSVRFALTKQFYLIFR